MNAPSDRIMRVQTIGANWEIYRMSCECTDSECDETFSIENIIDVDDEHTCEVVFYHDAYVKPQCFLERIVIALKVLFTGTYRSQKSIVLRDNQIELFKGLLNKHKEVSSNE